MQPLFFVCVPGHRVYSFSADFLGGRPGFLSNCSDALNFKLGDKVVSAKLLRN